ncbi:hypothetical protein VTO42DRAFT_6919 [Malbranchea cinnamomea]
MPAFKDEHILIVAPGSQTTLAQLGLPESFTPARHRFPTRMFPAEKKGEWEPYKVRQRLVVVKKPAAAPTEAPAAEKPTTDASASTTTTTTTNGEEEQKPAQEDTEMKDVPHEGESGEQNANKPEDASAEKDVSMVEEEQLVLEEDTTSDEGAVYPIRNGAIVDWPCFLALLTHIYNTLSPPFHTPILLIAQPAWTARDREILTQFIFEKFKTPAFCLMDSALAVCYAYGTGTATVVDVGYEKADVTAVTDFIVNDHGRGIALEGCGGEAMTDRLHELLESKGFTRDMCEQLKRSNICEILPAGTPLPVPGETGNQDSLKPPTAQPPGKGPEMSRNMDGEDDEGILDVAAIVTSGNTSEYLARREREKAERAAAKKGATADAAAKPVRLPNSKKEKATFQYEELVKIEPQDGAQSGTSQFMRQRREVEVGVERFQCVTANESKDGGYSILDKLAAQIHHTILSVSDATKRSELWDSLIILGNGSKIKGFPQALLATIQQKYVLSPSSGTIFTSEIPSALSTPLPTGGTTTPANFQNPGPMNHPAAHGVNPLLVAATHANNPAGPNAMSTNAAGATDPNSAGGSHHRSTGHSQTPTSVKQLKPPEYFPEWKKGTISSGTGGSSSTANQSSSSSSGAGGSGGTAKTSRGGGGANVGMEEAVFLGAQVAAKVIFIVDQGVSKGFLSRVEYNEVGPTAIHDYAL